MINQKSRSVTLLIGDIALRLTRSHFTLECSRKDRTVNVKTKPTIIPRKSYHFEFIDEENYLNFIKDFNERDKFPVVGLGKEYYERSGEDDPMIIEKGR